MSFADQKKSLPAGFFWPSDSQYSNLLLDVEKALKRSLT